MNPLRESFEDVADWCEQHLEAERGPEIGMTFGAMLRAYARLATMPDDPDDPANVRRRRKANEKAEELLLILSTRFIVAHGFPEPRWKKLVEPTSMRTNMTYDPGPQRGLK
jgi:hypothetical protein